MRLWRRELAHACGAVRMRTLNLEQAISDLKQSSAQLQEARDAALSATKESQ